MSNRSLSRAAVALAVLFILAVGSAPPVVATTYEVGDGKPFPSVGSVPWESLNAGDTVLIYWRSTPYKEKFVLSRVGTAANPITVRGVLGPGGERPVLDGNGATTRAQLNYYSRNRGVIKIGGSTVPFADGTTVMPQYLVIENLAIRSARPPFSFTGPDGSSESYTNPASSIYLEFGENITVRNCELHDNGNGFFAFSSNTIVTRNILLEGNYVHDNGNSGSNFEHNVYVEAIGVTYQYNHFGPLRAGASGNNIKDRSAGLVVRYNWIDGGNRQLDLVNAEDSSIIRADPGYHLAHVYGNVVLEHPNSGNNDIVLYGGDTGAANKYRKGTLHFYNNTVYSDRTDNTRLFRLSTNDQNLDARNNIAWVTAAASNLKLLDNYGRLTLAQNFFKTGYSPFNVGHPQGYDHGQRHRHRQHSRFRERSDPGLPPAVELTRHRRRHALNPVVLPTHNVVREYVKHLSSVPRAVNGPFDIGAYEF